MRPFNVKLICWIGLLVGLAMIVACGTNDFLDENGLRYRATMSFTDADEDDVLGIDVVQSICGTGNSTTPEIFTDAFASVSITIAENAPGLILESYSIDYVALGSSNSNNVIVTPPELEDIPDGIYNITLPSNSTSTFPILVMTMDTKDEFAIDQGWLNPGTLVYTLPAPDELQVARYAIRFVLHFRDEFGEDRDISVSRDVLVSAYDNC